MYFRSVLIVLSSLFFIITSGSVAVEHMPPDLTSTRLGGCYASDLLAIPAGVARSLSASPGLGSKYDLLTPPTIDLSSPPDSAALVRAHSCPMTFGRVTPPSPLAMVPSVLAEEDNSYPPLGVHESLVEVTNVDSVEEYVLREDSGKKGLIIFDADDVMFARTVHPDTGEEIVIRLYEDFEGLIARLKAGGHTVIVLTYNKKATILAQMAKVGLSEALFDEFVSCNKEGDPYKAKGKAFKEFMASEKAAALLSAKGISHFDFSIFIDNFDGFCRDMQNANRELGLKFTALHYVGYLEHYYRYIYHFLKQLQQDLEDLTSTPEAEAHHAEAKARRALIAPSLFKYEINLEEFAATFPAFELFKEWVKARKFAWPDLLHR